MKKLFLLVGLFLLYACGEERKDKYSKKEAEYQEGQYYNHSDTAKYVGMNACRQCHQKIYDSFLKTGMGQSFDEASKSKSAGDFTNPVIYDKFSDFYYKAVWKAGKFFIHEFRLSGRDTLYSRLEEVNYIIGSGQHTNSHLKTTNGYLTQMPMTFYTQKGKWDLPPGFENGHNTRFFRKIGLECISCHNAYPEFVEGSENKFKSVPEGINCERCHGPGSIHVALKAKGLVIDTATAIDYSIVNPSKLPADLQFDICQRCHLQGNAVLKEGRSFYDYKPGLKLSDFLTVFLPKFQGADDEFIMASHADRLKMSACFIESYKKAITSETNQLKPYKNALTCVTCHNPHISVKETGDKVFNNVCASCHGAGKKSEKTCTDKSYLSALNSKMGHTPNNLLSCVSCHMPRSGSIDIPHVSVHDHYIRKPISKNEKNKIKKFIGLHAINEKQVDRFLLAKAYINQYEKFEWNKVLLDSAEILLDGLTKHEIYTQIESLVHLYFLKGNYEKIVFYIESIGRDELLNKKLNLPSSSNQHAWTCYRISETYYVKNNLQAAYAFIKRSNELAPYVPDFMVKMADVLADMGKTSDAEAWYKKALTENPNTITAYTNLGYLYLTLKQDIKAEDCYKKALLIDPDNEGALLNYAGLYNFRGKKDDALKMVKMLLKKQPENQKAKAILEAMKKDKKSI